MIECYKCCLLTAGSAFLFPSPHGPILTMSPCAWMGFQAGKGGHSLGLCFLWSLNQTTTSFSGSCVDQAHTWHSLAERAGQSQIRTVASVSLMGWFCPHDTDKGQTPAFTTWAVSDSCILDRFHTGFCLLYSTKQHQVPDLGTATWSFVLLSSKNISWYSFGYADRRFCK